MGGYTNRRDLDGPGYIFGIHYAPPICKLSPMIEHLIFFRLKPDLPADTAKRIFDGFRSMQGVIPGLRDVVIGHNVAIQTDYAADAEIGVRMLFDSHESLRAYLTHPQHQKLAAFVLASTDKVAICDLERSDPAASASGPLLVRHEGHTARERSACGWRDRLISREDAPLSPAA